jgi:nitrogen-specific signal transduction histidine kinase
VTYANPAAETLLAHGRKHLVGAALDKALPGNDEFLRRVEQSIDSRRRLQRERPRARPRRRARAPALRDQPGGASGTAAGVLALEFRELEQQLKIARESR